MKIALIGSAPSSVGLAPFSDPEWLIWGCSPGAYPRCPRADVWFELHRWQPPVIGRADLQVPWFTPEYCQWLALRPRVYMVEAVPEIPHSMALPFDALRNRYGDYFFSSSLAWMMAMAIETIRELRDLPLKDAATGEVQPEKHSIGLWGVDMAADEEYRDQKLGCAFFIQIAMSLGIEVVLPPQSDLMRPPPLYGLVETLPANIKMEARLAELTGRLDRAKAERDAKVQEVMYLEGAKSNHEYHMRTWVGAGEVRVANLNEVLGVEPVPPEPQPAYPPGSIQFVDHPGEDDHGTDVVRL